MKRSYTLDRTLSHLTEGVHRLQDVKDDLSELGHNDLEEASRLIWGILKSVDYELIRYNDRKEDQRAIAELMGRRADRHQKPEENQGELKQ